MQIGRGAIRRGGRGHIFSQFSRVQRCCTRNAKSIEKEERQLCDSHIRIGSEGNIADTAPISIQQTNMWERTSILCRPPYYCIAHTSVTFCDAIRALYRILRWPCLYINVSIAFNSTAFDAVVCVSYARSIARTCDRTQFVYACAPNAPYVLDEMMPLQIIPISSNLLIYMHCSE